MTTKRTNLVLFGSAVVLTAILYGLVGWGLKSTGVYEFFFSRGAYQPISVGFFFFGLILVVNRWYVFRAEIAASQVPLPEAVPSKEKAKELAEQINGQYGSTILGRRLASLLRGYGRGEELGALEERLKAKDRNDLDASAGLIGWVRSLPPLVGLLGTLDGLRGGISEIANINNANDLDALRGGLQQFAHHASTAFDTTLLGISAAAVLSAAIFLARKTEDAHLANVDEQGDALARQFVHGSEVNTQVTEAVQGILREFRNQFQAVLVSATGPLVTEFGGQLKTGVSDAVRGWLGEWKQELAGTCKELTSNVAEHNQATLAAVQGTLDLSVSALSDAAKLVAESHASASASFQASAQTSADHLKEALDAWTERHSSEVAIMQAAMQEALGQTVNSMKDAVNAVAERHNVAIDAIQSAMGQSAVAMNAAVAGVAERQDRSVSTVMSALSDSLQESVSSVTNSVQALERAMARPRPLHIEIRERELQEIGSNGR